MHFAQPNDITSQYKTIKNLRSNLKTLVNDRN
jgi:hypothetical protein